MKVLFPGEANLAPRALQWILQFKEVSCIIRGASKLKHVLSNLSVYNLPALTEEQLSLMNEIYEQYIRKQVHHLW